MEISYLGHSSFRIKGGKATLITDPYDDSQLGMKIAKVEADIITVSHQHSDHNAVNLIKGNPFIIWEPGEYEIKGVSILGYPSFHDSQKGQERGENTIYLIEMDGLRICHLGDLGEDLNEEKLEEIGAVDILMIPVGGYYTIEPKRAAELVTKIEPLIVLPMHFKREKMGGSLAKLTKVEDFLKEMAVAKTSPLPKLLISKDKLPEERQVVLLEMKNEK